MLLTIYVIGVFATAYYMGLEDSEITYENFNVFDGVFCLVWFTWVWIPLIEYLQINQNLGRIIFFPLSWLYDKGREDGRKK